MCQSSSTLVNISCEMVGIAIAPHGSVLHQPRSWLLGSHPNDQGFNVRFVVPLSYVANCRVTACRLKVQEYSIHTIIIFVT